ncbi:hypothetical protein CL634_06960 [bacterium]|nr:hypothetical protein [bacterium]
MTIRTKTEMYNQITTLLADNATGDITEAVMRSVTTDLFDSCFSNTVTVVDELADLGTPVGDYYELPAGRYMFNKDIDFGTKGLDLVDTDGIYFFESNSIQTLTYTGTTPFIKTTATGVVLQAQNFFISSANGTAIQMINGNSLIMSLIVFVSCKKVADLQDNSFLSVFDAVPMVACEDGITCHNVEVVTLNRPQWNAGLNLSGVAFRFTGASSSRCIATSLEAICDTTEAFIHVDGTYAGEMTIVGGVLTSGDFWAAGSRDQKDEMLTSFHVLGATDSRFIGSASVQDNVTTTTISTIDVFEDFNLNGLAQAGSNIEGWSLTNTTTGELTCDVDGFSGILSATISATGSGGSSEYHYRATKNGVQINGIIPNELSSSMSNTGLSVPLEADAGDVIKIQVANHDNTSDITIRYADINVS